MNTWAKPGARCMCIGNSDWVGLTSLPHPGDLPKYRGIYTIEHVLPGNGRLWLVLREMPIECCYLIDHFRPMTERTQEEDVALVKSLLREIDALERAEMLLDEFELP